MSNWGSRLVIGCVLAGGVIALGVHFVAQAQSPHERPRERSAEGAQPAALPEAPVRLSYSFPPEGTTQRFRLREEARETTEDRGREVTQRRTTELTYTQRIDELDEENGTAWLALTYERVRYRQQSTLNPTPLSFDSAAGEPPLDPALRPYAELAGRTVRLELGPRGQVQHVEGFSELLEEMFAELEEKPFERLRKLLEQQFSNEAMRTALTRLYLHLPSRPVEPGNYWEQELTQPIPFVGDVGSQTRLTLRRFEHDEAGQAQAVLGVDTEYRHSRDEEAREQARGLEVVPGVAGHASLEEGSLQGTARLDLETGFVVASELTQRMVLSFRAESVAGRSAVVDLRSSTEATIHLERLD